MLIEEVISLDEKQIWGRTGKRVVRKYRCTSGQRAGRIVPSIAACFTPINVKRRAKMKQTRRRLGKRMARLTKRTKKINPASRRVQALNKAARKSRKR